MLDPQAAVSASGAAAVSFDELNIDAQANAHAYVARAAPGKRFGRAQAVPGAQTILALGYSSSVLELLTAAGPRGQPCCSTVQVLRAGARGFRAPQTLLTNTGGGTTGRLVTLANGHLLAVIAGPQGLWVSEAGRDGHFGAVRALTPTGVAPAALAATGTARGGAAVAWSVGAGQSIQLALAPPGRTPGRASSVLKLAAGHSVDELGLVARPKGETLAWTESYTDAAGAYHARAWADDLSSGGFRPRALSSADDVASALTLAGDGSGDEVAAWDSCITASGTCTVDSAVRLAPAPKPKRSQRRRGHRRPPARSAQAASSEPWFASAQSLGVLDGGQSPQLSLGAQGTTALAWIGGGRLLIATRSARATRFAAAAPASGDVAGNPALAVGPGGVVVATWSQGTYVTAVYAARGRY